MITPDAPRRNGEGHESSQDALLMARIGIWLMAGALTMFFGALAVMWLLKMPDRLSYSFNAPTILWASTGFLLLSSITFHAGLRAIRTDQKEKLRRFLLATLGLGAAFVATQLVAWSQLLNAGVVAQKNPFSGLFYILTGLHAAHVIGGMIWAACVYRAAARGYYNAKRHIGVEVGAIYWHVMDAVWIVFFVLIMFV